QRLERMEDETNALALLPVALLANALERSTQRGEHLVRVVVEGNRLGDGVEEVRPIPAEDGREANKSRALGKSTRPNARAGDADDEFVCRRRVGTQKPRNSPELRVRREGHVAQRVRELTLIGGLRSLEAELLDRDLLRQEERLRYEIRVVVATHLMRAVLDLHESEVPLLSAVARGLEGPLRSFVVSD